MGNDICIGEDTSKHSDDSNGSVATTNEDTYMVLWTPKCLILPIKYRHISLKVKQNK